MKCTYCGKILLGEEAVCADCRLLGKDKSAEKNDTTASPDGDWRSPIDGPSSGDAGSNSGGAATEGEHAAEQEQAPDNVVLFAKIALMICLCVTAFALFLLASRLFSARQPADLTSPTTGRVLSVPTEIPTATPTVPPTPIPFIGTLTLSGIEFTVRSAAASVSRDGRCMDIALYGVGLAPEQLATLHEKDSLLAIPEAKPHLVVRLLASKTIRQCAVDELRSYALVFTDANVGAPFPYSRDRIETVRSGTWNRPGELLGLECTFDNNASSLRGAMRGAATLDGVAVQWDVAFFAPISISRRAFCDRAVPELKE